MPQKIAGVCPAVKRVCVFLLLVGIQAWYTNHKPPIFGEIPHHNLYMMLAVIGIDGMCEIMYDYGQDYFGSIFKALCGSRV